jgi:hypothetical protein
MTPVREHRLTTEKSGWSYEVYYVNTGTRVYWEIKRKMLATTHQPWKRVESGDTPEAALDTAIEGGGYYIAQEGWPIR